MSACNSVLKVFAFKVKYIFQKVKASHQSPQVQVIAKVNTKPCRRGHVGSFVTSSLGASGTSCYLTMSRVLSAKQGAGALLGAPGAPDLLSHSAAIFGEASSPCWCVLVTWRFMQRGLLPAPHPTLSVLGK